MFDLTWTADEYLSSEYNSTLFLLGFYGNSTIEWLLTIIACLRTPIVTVGLYSDIDEFYSWANYLKLKHLFTTSDNLPAILPSCELGLLELSSIIVLGKVSPVLSSAFAELGVKLIAFKDLARGPGRVSTDLNQKTHPCFLSLTAGTTEASKFVIISQENLMASLNSCFHLAQEVSTEDSYLSYMNFSLLGDVMFIFIISLSGGRIGLAFDPLNFVQDAQILKPTFMISIPQVVEKLYSGIKGKVEGLTGLARSMFNKGFAKKLENYKKTGELKHKFWDSLVFKSIRNLLGGKLRVLVVGTAICNSDVTRFLKIVLGCEVLEGYGMIESTVCAFCTFPGDPSTGNIGGPLIGIEARLHYTGMIFEEYNHYYGELQLRGPAMSQQYYKSTAPPLTSTNWFSTGDLVAVLPETGALTFIDRQAFIYKSHSGKWVCTQKLEVLYKQSKLVSQILIHTTSSIEGVLAVIVPSFEYVSQKFSPSNLKTFCRSKDFESTLLREFLVIEKIHKLGNHEKIVQVFVETEAWTSREFVTQTLKLRKYKLIEHYAEIFDKMTENYFKCSF